MSFEVELGSVGLGVFSEEGNEAQITDGNRTYRGPIVRRPEGFFIRSAAGDYALEDGDYITVFTKRGTKRDELHYRLRIQE